MPPTKSLTGRPLEHWKGKQSARLQCFQGNSILCLCDSQPRREAVVRETRTDTNGNLGRKFWACAGHGGLQCEFFVWNNELRTLGYTGNKVQTEPNYVAGPAATAATAGGSGGTAGGSGGTAATAGGSGAAARSPAATPEKHKRARPPSSEAGSSSEPAAVSVTVNLTPRQRGKRARESAANSQGEAHDMAHRLAVIQGQVDKLEREIEIQRLKKRNAKLKRKVAKLKRKDSDSSASSHAESDGSNSN